jgi:hypothetical protein
MSTRGRRQGPLVDMAESPLYGSQNQKQTFFCFVEKSVEVEGFEPQFLAWKSNA